MSRMARLLHHRLDDVPLEAVLHALSDPGRLAIVRRLHDCELAKADGLACAVAAPEGMPKATMSNHFGVLRAAGLIRSEKAGVRMVNRLRTEELAARFPGLLDAVLAAASPATR